MVQERDDLAEESQNTLESDVSLSDSLIWRRQRDAYVQRGLQTWTEDMVPQFITNNPFFADLHARAALAFISDCFALHQTSVDSRGQRLRVRILELGAGTGRFAFLFLRHLEMLLQAHGIPLDTVHYCLTDCSESIVESWRVNEKLSQFAERKILQFEVLDVQEEKLPGFLGEGEYLDGPLIVIANYFLDSLPQDAFRIQEGQIFEYLQTTKKNRQDPNGVEPEALRQLQFSYKEGEVPGNRYDDECWNRILNSYRFTLPGAGVLFPTVGLRTLQAIRKIARGPVLFLASDKGFVHEQDLALAQGPPVFEFHTPNVFSQMVNFHAIGKYVAEIGGQTLMPKKRSLSMSICAFLLGLDGRPFLATKLACEEIDVAFGPEDLFNLFSWLNPRLEEMDVQQILALLRLSRWDPTTLTRVFPALVRQIRNAVADREELRNAVTLTWSNHFPMTRNDNALAFYCGVLLLELRFFEEAVAMFKQSQDLFGRSPATSYNLGLCASGLGRTSEALEQMEEACRLDPAFEPAQLLLRKMRKNYSDGTNETDTLG